MDICEYSYIHKLFDKAKSNCLISILPSNKSLKYYEKELLLDNKLDNITHKGASSIWLETYCNINYNKSIYCNVYRPMGDKEILYLIENKQLPNTQPYQAIMKGEEGRIYADKYLNGKKWTDTNPTTVVEFTIPLELLYYLESLQHKIEDGCISYGLGFKAGNGLSKFNEYLQNGESSYRIVKIKRQIRKKRR